MVLTRFDQNSQLQLWHQNQAFKECQALKFNLTGFVLVFESGLGCFS